MTELGKLLQQTRKKKKYSLEEVHKLTKISQRYIRALEESDASVFPAELYRRSFLKNYAKFLGLNVDEVIKMYEQEKTGVQYDLFSNEEILQQTIDKTKKVDIEEIKEARHNKAEKMANANTATVRVETEKQNEQPEIVIAENKEVENKQDLNDKPKNEIKEETKIKTVKKRGRKKQSVKVETKNESGLETREKIKEPVVINDIKEDVIAQNNVEKEEITEEKIIHEAKKENKQGDNFVSEVKQEVKDDNKQEDETVSEIKVEKKQEDKPFLFNIKLVSIIIVCILLVILLIKCSVDKNTDVQPKEEVVSDIVVEEQEEQKPEVVKQTVTIDAIGDTWIRVIADDVKIFEGFLYTGQQQTCYANEMFNIRVGNADGLKVTFNDNPVDVISLAKEDGTATLILKKDTEI